MSTTNTSSNGLAAKENQILLNVLKVLVNGLSGDEPNPLILGQAIRYLQIQGIIGGKKMGVPSSHANRLADLLKEAEAEVNAS